MAENPSQTLKFENNITINAITFIVAAILLFLTIIFFFLLYFYAKHHWRSRSRSNPPIRTLGLNPTILSTIPITLFKPSEFNDGIECAVCLSELAPGENVRFLPKCSHGFHLKCIDTWFHSHSTCPICRCAVGSEEGEENDESGDLHVNVSERNLMISIPIRSIEGVVESIRVPVEEIKSPFRPKI